MKRWYVVQVYAGFEEQVKKDLEKRIVEEGLQDVFGEVLIPSAKMKRFFDTEESKDQQLFPGYLLVEMETSPATLRVVTMTPKVSRFLGGKEPIALSKKEIEKITSQMKGEVIVSPPDVSEFNVGSEIEIADGPFKGFVGLIEKVDVESERMTIMVSIFGRLTPVEVRFDQVKR
ncbi:transcription termination/antitermination factor NusG [Candidatus Babeliales bacterium]|nr:transcription termination/antitermination factor NusG [Candidatus Babeliales bacterium]